MGLNKAGSANAIIYLNECSFGLSITVLLGQCGEAVSLLLQNSTKSAAFVHNDKASQEVSVIDPIHLTDFVYSYGLSSGRGVLGEVN